MEKGVVSWFDEQKKYGFIIPDLPQQGRKDIFVHKVNVESQDQSLEKGDRVEFEVIQGLKGLEAKHVKVIEEED